MKIRPSTESAYHLVHEGSLALAEIESHGMRIDVDRLDRMIDKCTDKIRRLENSLKEDEIYKTWRKTYGDKMSFSSRSQLGRVLFDVMDYETSYRTKKNRMQVTEESLEELQVPFIKQYLRMEKLKKLRSTYLKGVRREVVDGFLRPSFNLHLTLTHRSSSDSPNFQNLPVRDPIMGKAIRSCFIPRNGHVLVEIDYSALEFKIASSFWSDPAMISYASDSSKDIHRDMAMECYKLNSRQWTKQTRFYAKNQFVFPQLYGSYYVNCAKNLWNAIGRASLTTADGVGLYQHLAGKGIEGLDDFEEQIREVEARFAKRFPKWDIDRERWWRDYQKRGWFRMMTGFVCAGVFRRNDLMNWPIQGPAFHCLLWSLIRLIKWMKRSKMRSCIIGQIHDSVVADIRREELDDYLAKAKRVMTEDVREVWDWIITPLEVEAEIAEANWFDKKEVSI